MFSIGFPFIVLPIFVPAQQLWTTKFAISAVALFLTFYSVEAAILVAVMIYKMQKLDMEKENEKRLRLAKSAMGTAIESGIGWIICPQMNRYPGIAATTKEIFIEHMAYFAKPGNL